MAKFGLSIDKEQGLAEIMFLMGIIKSDLIEKFITSSGPGGQKVNKSSSCVYIKHIPTGIEVKCQKDRSQAMNRFFARRLLTQKISESILGKLSLEKQRIEKIKRQKRKRSKRAKLKVLETKCKQSEKKRLRNKTITEI